MTVVTVTIDETQVCPRCNADLKGALIPVECKDYYGNETHFSRLIGVEYSYVSPYRYDGVSEWLCPDCGYREGRWSGRELRNFDQEKPPRLQEIDG